MSKIITLTDYYYLKEEIDDLLEEKASISHSHGNITNEGVITNQVNKNVVTDADGKITTEPKPTIPLANRTTTNIKMNGTQSAGSLDYYARADHVHPVDTSRAEASHTHDDRYYTETEIDNLLNNKEDKSNKVTSLSNSSTDDEYPSAKAVYNQYYWLSNGLTSVANNIWDTLTPLTSHSHGNISNDGKIHISGVITQNKNVVTDSNGLIIVEEKPTIPSANTAATNIKMNGTQSAGSLSTFAKADHVHPTDTSKISTSAIKNDLTTGGASNVLSAEQGKQLKTQIDSIVSDNDLVMSSNIEEILDDLLSETVVVSSKNPIIMTGDSTQLIARIYGDYGENQTIEFYEKIDGGDDLLSTVTTNNGVAYYNFDGGGTGKREFYAKWGSFLSETFVVTDAIYFDSASSDNTSRYAFNTSVGNSLTFEDGYYLMTGGTGSRYITYSMSNVSALIGKTIRIEADLNPSDNVALGIFPHNSGGYVNNLSSWFEGEGTFHFDVELSDTTIDSCLFRIYVNSTNATVEIRNLKIYPI